MGRWDNDAVSFDRLVGEVFVKVEVSPDQTEVIFETAGGKRYLMYHEQDCCERVWLEEVIGDLEDLVDSPIILASENSSREEPPKDQAYDSYTWTFYHLRTRKGPVTLRWFGTSNGYYSESVTLVEVT